MKKKQSFSFLLFLIFSSNGWSSAPASPSSTIKEASHNYMEKYELFPQNPTGAIEELSQRDTLRINFANVILWVYENINANSRFSKISLVPNDTGLVFSVKSEKKRFAVDWSLHDMGSYDCFSPSPDIDMVESISSLAFCETNILDCTSASFIAISVLIEFMNQNKSDFDSATLLKFENLYSKDFKERLNFFDVLSDKVNLGSAVSFMNFRTYNLRHRYGYFNGENVFFVGYDSHGFRKYIGYGDFFKDGPKKAQEIQASLTYSFLKPPSDLEISYANSIQCKFSVVDRDLPLIASENVFFKKFESRDYCKNLTFGAFCLRKHTDADFNILLKYLRTDSRYIIKKEFAIFQ